MATITVIKMEQRLIVLSMHLLSHLQNLHIPWGHGLHLHLHYPRGHHQHHTPTLLNHKQEYLCGKVRKIENNNTGLTFVLLHSPCTNLPTVCLQEDHCSRIGQLQVNKTFAKLNLEYVGNKIFISMHLPTPIWATTTTYTSTC